MWGESRVMTVSKDRCCLRGWDPWHCWSYPPPPPPPARHDMSMECCGMCNRPITVRHWLNVGTSVTRRWQRSCDPGSDPFCTRSATLTCLTPALPSAVFRGDIKWGLHDDTKRSGVLWNLIVEGIVSGNEDFQKIILFFFAPS